MGKKKERLEEHRIFKNQMIIMTIIMLGVGFGMSIPELVGFGIIVGIVAIYNIFTHIENKKDYKKLKNKK